MPGQHGAAGEAAKETYLPASPPGVIGGAVIKAGRRSAHLTRLSLARLLAVGPDTVAAWEQGIIPLFCVSYRQLRDLADALEGTRTAVGCQPGDVLLGSQCDLLVTGMLHGFEDYAEAPPIEEDNAAGDAARSLLHWALSGVVPAWYQHTHTDLRPLLASPDAERFTTLARELQASSRGRDLISYGTNLLRLTKN